MSDERGAYFYVCGLVIWVGEAYVCWCSGVACRQIRRKFLRQRAGCRLTAGTAGSGAQVQVVRKAGRQVQHSGFLRSRVLRKGGSDTGLYTYTRRITPLCVCCCVLCCLNSQAL